MKISGLTISNGNAVDGVLGGTNPGAFGGGIWNNSTLTISNLAVSGNLAGSGGSNAGALAGNGGYGGGIYNSGTLTIVNSTISGNRAGDGGNGGNDGIGGVCGNGGGILNAGTLTVINSTISGNQAGHGGSAGSSGVAGDGGNGGGISNNGPASIFDSTITGNQAGTPGSAGDTVGNSGLGGGIFRNGGTLTLKNTIVAGNLDGAGSGRDDVNGTLDASSSFNLIGDGTGMAGISNGNSGNQVGSSGSPINALLGALTANGGGTQTHLLLPGSPAINAGSNALLPLDTVDLDGDSDTAEALPVDQRGPGFNRVVNTTVDIGAVEVNYTSTATAGTPQSAVINGAFATQLQATVKESGNDQSGVTVTFTAPASGASGTFPGNVTTANVITDASGVATAPVFNANGNAGSYNVVASDGGGLASVNFALTNTKFATTTGLSSSVNPSEFGQSVTFTATVTSGAGTPTGTVQFKDGGANLGSPQTLNASGVAQLPTSSLTAGSHTITADYSGNANFAASSGSLSGGQLVKPSLSINDVSFAEGNSGTTNLIFTVTLAAASNLTVNVDYATANGTATLADNDYQAASGTLTFNPGEVTRTITVLVNGDQKFEPDETVLMNLTNAVNATISDNQGVGTILNDDTLQLILDESGPDANQAAAFDSLLFLRDPFHVQSIADWLDLGPDGNTRVTVFAGNLQLNQGETASVVVVSLVDANDQTFDVPAEDVRRVPNFSFTQVEFRLPNNLAAGVWMVTIKAHGQISNTGTIRIVLP